MKQERKKAVGYIRVSTTIQAKEGESLSTQKQQIEEYAKSKSWKLEHYILMREYLELRLSIEQALRE